MTLTLSGTSGLSDVDGSAATPAIRGTDANTGIFFPAADTVGVSTGGSERVRVDSSGNVGIGRTPTNFRLEIAGKQWIQDATSPATYWGNTLSDYLASYYDVSAKIGYVSADGAGTQLAFRTAATERMRIDSSGNLLVGTTSTSDSEKFSVNQTSAKAGAFINVNVASSTANPAISCRKYDNSNTTSQTYLTFAYNQGVSGSGGIQGNGASGVQFFSSSDARLKENIVKLEPQLANILALKPSKFDYIDGPKDCTGFIAQEMEAVYPDAIGETPDGFKTIGGISIMETRLIKAIQEQQALIQSLTARITALEAK